MNYVQSCWYVAAWSSDLEPETPIAVPILGERLVLWRDSAGAVHALEDRCVHRMAPLSLGRCEGPNLRCMYHGLLFSGEGEVIEIPGQDSVPPKARLRAYPVIERHSWVWVWMGDDRAADPGLIPPAVGLDDERFILGRGQLDYDAEARLICDNLLDFSHLSYVHATSFEAGPDLAARLSDIAPVERGVRVSRWTENGPDRRNKGAPERYDNFLTYDFLLPGVLLMESASFAIGTARALDFARPDFERAVTGRNFTSQAVTPMTATTARYFFSWGPHRSHGDEAVRDAMMQTAAMAFEEDRVMIEAQSRVIAQSPGRPPIPSAHDRGVTLFNRLVERLSRAEQGNPAATG